MKNLAGSNPAMRAGFFFQCIWWSASFHNRMKSDSKNQREAKSADFIKIEIYKESVFATD